MRPKDLNRNTVHNSRDPRLRNRAAQRETWSIGHAAAGQELWLLVRCLFPGRLQYRGISFVADDDTVETLQLFKLLHRHAEFLDLHGYVSTFPFASALL